MEIPLVADTSKKIASAYGVLVTDENDDMFGAALRGLFIIGKHKSVMLIVISNSYLYMQRAFLFLTICSCIRSNWQNPQYSD